MGQDKFHSHRSQQHEPEGPEAPAKKKSGEQLSTHAPQPAACGWHSHAQRQNNFRGFAGDDSIRAFDLALCEAGDPAHLQTGSVYRTHLLTRRRLRLGLRRLVAAKLANEFALGRICIYLVELHTVIVFRRSLEFAPPSRFQTAHHPYTHNTDAPFAPWRVGWRWPASRAWRSQLLDHW
jgi:hypothetical protein